MSLIYRCRTATRTAATWRAVLASRQDVAVCMSRCFASVPSNKDTNLFKDQNDTWVDRHAPQWIRPYLKIARVDRQIGTWLAVLPGWWGLALAAPAGALPDPTLMATFFVGGLLMRSFGCVVNDLWDRDIDGEVERTRDRPLASGALTVPQALVFGGAVGAAALATLLTLNTTT